MIDRTDIMTKAIQLRKKLGEDSSSPIDIFSISLGIENLSLVFYPMGEKLSGMCIKANNCSIIAINSEMSLGRQRFSLAHEFYHNFYDDITISLCGKNIGFGKDTEREADLFASYFLMPNDEFENKVNLLISKTNDKKLSIYEIIRIEQYFGVSHHAAVIRLKENKFISQADVDYYLQISVRNKAESMGFNGDLYRPLSKEKQYGTYGYYIEQVDMLQKMDLISQGKYDSLLLDAFRPDLVYGINEGGEIID